MNILAPTLNRTLRICAIALVATITFAGTSSGFTTSDGGICYDDMSGPRVTYKNIFESSQTDDFDSNDAGESIGHYGPPTLIGDVMSFNTPQFVASSIIGGRPADLTDGRLAMEISAGPGEAIQKLHLFERGSISLTSNGMGNSHADVDAPMFLTVHKVLLNDGTAAGLRYTLPTSARIQSLIELSPSQISAGQWRYSDDPEIEVWEGEIMMDIPTLLAAELADKNIALPAGTTIRGFTRAQYTMDNRLESSAGDGSSFIDKKEVQINPFPVVPEPSAFALAFPLMGMGLWLRRRRN